MFEDRAKGLYPILQGEVRPPTDQLRAGVSGMGFGGINSHVTVESGDAPSAKLSPDIDPNALLVSSQDTELFVLAAPSLAALGQRVQQVADLAQGISVAEMADLAWHLTTEVSPQAVKAAVVASTPDDLQQQLQQLQALLSTTPPALGQMVTTPDQGGLAGPGG